jgi:hypothetical protein
MVSDIEAFEHVGSSVVTHEKPSPKSKVPAFALSLSLCVGTDEKAFSQKETDENAPVDLPL